MALIENIQREDLNPIDQAAAYERLSTDFGMTQEEIAAAVGKDRSSVANHLRLLKLPQEVRAEVAARPPVDGPRARAPRDCRRRRQRQVAREVIARNLSVRETEAMVKRTGRGAISGTTVCARRHRRPHPGRGGKAADDARHARPHHPQRQGGTN